MSNLELIVSKPARASSGRWTWEVRLSNATNILFTWIADHRGAWSLWLGPLRFSKKAPANV